jgi:hypothetical protein
VTRVGSGAPGAEGPALDWDAKLAEWEAKWDKLDGTSLAGSRRPFLTAWARRGIGRR